ncbi:MAG TPA: hypothetical protein VFT59_00805 [Candidatus Saccharimonadales bacterium]|nr:hypothetical protein [Candidatus Saccharimonadales bacterium]
MDPQISSPKKRWPLSRKMTIILAVSLIAILVITLVVILTSAKQDNGPSQNQQNTYYDRPGYDRSQLGGSIADPFAVRFEANSQSVEYRGSKVVQACNILTMDDITSQDILINANTLPTVISRTYNNGAGKGAYNQDLTSSSLTALGLGMDVNSCNYVLKAPEGVHTIGLNVFQPFAVSMNVVDQQLQEGYTQANPLEGLEVFKKQSDTSPNERKTEYILRQQDKGAFYIAVELPNDKASKEQTILEAAAKNFIREQSNPSGPKTLKYDSPIYTKNFAHACELLSNDHIKSLSGKDASPLVREGIASSVAVLTASDKTPYLNIINECIATTPRDNTMSLLSGELQLKVETTSFLLDLPAKEWVKAQLETNPNNRANMELTQSVGDASVAYTDANGGQHVIFSKGRIVVDVSVGSRSLSQAGIRDLASAAEKLTPIARSMADNVKQ